MKTKATALKRKKQTRISTKSKSPSRSSLLKGSRTATSSSVRSGDVPVTKKMLYLVRDELKAEIRGTDAKINGLDAKINGSDAKINGLDAKINGLEQRMDARFEKMTAEIHRIGLLVEEQNARNNIVLDGLTALFGRQDRIERRVDEIERTFLRSK